MKTGDRVRFLNAVGGGIVRRFQNKDVVIVEEDDGFETPILIRECVVIDEKHISENNIPRKPAIPSIQDASLRASTREAPTAPKVVSSDKPEYQYEETSGGDRLNVYLAYLPMDIKNIGKCNYETYLVNNSNYFLFFNYMSRQNNAWLSRCAEIIEPNTRLFIEEFSKTQLNDLEKICVQIIAFKQGKPYSLKNAYSVELRIDPVRFYKLHSFRENDFFDDEALLYPLIENDTAVRELLISAADLQEAMTQKNQAEQPRRQLARKDTTPDILEVDLHSNQLLDTTAGLSPTDILNYQLDTFRKVMEENKNKKGRKIVFIHGKGEGVLRNALLTELKTKYKHFPFQDASFREYGFGATMVRVR